MKRRVLSLVLVLSLLIGSAVRPQRVDAVALTATVVAASAAAILTACGVTYWAASQTDAVNYISGKIDDYLTSIGESVITYDEWLELNAGSNIFDVVSGGVMSFSSGVANKLLDFCRWLQNSEGIESDGNTITAVSNLKVQLGNDIIGSIKASIISDNTILIDFDISSVSSSTENYIYIPLSENQTGNIAIFLQDTELNYSGYLRMNGKLSNYDGTSLGNNSIPTYVVKNGYVGGLSNNGNYDYLRIVIWPGTNSRTIIGNTTMILQSNNTTQVTAQSPVSITPSEFVNIPAAIDSDAVFAIKPDVNLAAGDSVDEAADTILDGITSEEGLSSTVEDTPDTTWGWLYTLLVNIAEAITDGVSDIKQAVLGLADSIYNKFTTILQDIKTGVSSVTNSITSAVSQLLSAIQALPTTIYSQFTQILQDIKTGIQGIALDIYTDVINALTYVFVPSQAFIDTYVASLYATFDNHFSILSYPFSILGEFITRASGIGSPDPVFTWGNIFEPFSGNLLISAGSYNLNSALSNQTFAYMYQLYMIIVKGFMSFWFLTYLYNWFCDVFKMREADYSPPEVDDI